MVWQVLGMCFFAGGLKYKEQRFNSTVASTMCSLMAVATSCLIIPAALYSNLPQEKVDIGIGKIVLQLSRLTSIVMLVLYVMYLWFQLKSHAHIFSEPNIDPNETEEERRQREQLQSHLADDHGESAVLLNVWEAGFVLIVVTLLVSVCAEYLVGSIEGIVESSGISKTFIGLILIPIVGNAAEHVTAIVVAMKNKVGIAVFIFRAMLLMQAFRWTLPSEWLSAVACKLLFLLLRSSSSWGGSSISP